MLKTTATKFAGQACVFCLYDSRLYFPSPEKQEAWEGGKRTMLEEGDPQNYMWKKIPLGYKATSFTTSSDYLNSDLDIKIRIISGEVSWEVLRDLSTALPCPYLPCL